MWLTMFGDVCVSDACRGQHMHIPKIQFAKQVEVHAAPGSSAAAASDCAALRPCKNKFLDMFGACTG